jgi:hypothetical protein
VIDSYCVGGTDLASTGMAHDGNLEDILAVLNRSYMFTPVASWSVIALQKEEEKMWSSEALWIAEKEPQKKRRKRVKRESKESQRESEERQDQCLPQVWHFPTDVDKMLSQGHTQIQNPLPLSY